DPQKPGKSYCKWMGAADDVDLFDPHFFNITPREAELMDPQQRLFLQCAWHAIEDAGIDPVRLAGAQCGVFVGSGPSGYADLIEERNAYSLLGSSGSILAARIAYLLDLHGPAISLDTACSSSLVAIAEACNSLLLGNSELALAGGASVLIGPSMFIDTSKVSMLSSGGRCFTFDHRANGFVPGEGVGVLLLKRLADAERDGDPIRAVIRGWGVNQDGKTNGITAPNPQAQTRLLRGIYERFGIDCTSIELVEAHGTGTPLGDPIEIEGLTGAFGGDSRRAACALGSVKSNVGHLLAAAGIAGAMKIMLALERHELPPTINFEKPNDHISLAGTPFYVNTARKDWPLPEAGPRRAAVSAFGFSGTNAHLVLEEYRRPARAQPVGNGPWIFPLSARTPEQLVEYAAALASFVAGRPDLDPADLAATFQSGRTPFAHRLAFIFRDRNELLATLDAIAGGRTSSGVYRTGPIRSGTGGQSGAPQSLDALARQWASGADIAWPIDTSSGRRIQAPGYPFARRRCWIEPPAAAVLPGDSPAGAKAPHAVEAKPRLHPLIGRAAADPDHDAFTATFRGDERDLSDLVAGDPLVGLFLPEMARAAGDLATQRTVLGLKHLVWGKPAPANGEACELSVVLRSDAQGFLYDVVVNGNRSDPCHVGALILEGEDVAWPEPLGVEKLRAHGAAEDVTEAWRRFASADRGPRPDNPISQAADRAVLRVYRRDGEVLAHLRFPTDAAAPRGMSIDPLHLHALWRLMVFGDPDGLTAEPRYPYALERLLHAGPLPDELFVRLWWPGQEGRTREPAMAVVYDMKGKPRLMLDGLLTRRIDELPDLALVGT
ncbi:MAG TPA: beta-ketoacyl synthase N-terminal-like domain-containing protein, partial [Xanthobacteraceae bacterium]